MSLERAGHLWRFGGYNAQDLTGIVRGPNNNYK